MLQTVIKLLMPPALKLLSTKNLNELLEDLQEDYLTLFEEYNDQVDIIRKELAVRIKQTEDGNNFMEKIW